MPATLPAELLNLIIPASVDERPTRANLLANQRQLCSLARVNRTWNAWATPQIHQHMHLSQKQLRKLARNASSSASTAKLSKGHEARSTSSCRSANSADVVESTSVPLEQRAHQVKTLALGKWIDEYGSGLKTMLKKFDSATQVYVEGTKSWSALTSVSSLPSIETLHLTRVYNSLPPPDGFPQVQRLSVTFGLNDGIDWSFLSTHKLPKLSTLVLDPYDWTFSQAEGFQTAFAAASPQLQALALGGSDNGQVDWIGLLRKADNLKHLYIHTAASTNLVMAVPNLPSHLETLRIASVCATPEQVATMLGAQQLEGQPASTPTPLENLRLLTLPCASTNGWDLGTEKSRKAIEAIETWCHKKNIKLEYVPRGKAALEDWTPEESKPLVA
ncbi:hypothetical protein OIO90_004655 [Microbotryomycetes sp. JL221]|nr:hypothetical protein OIO90_004655 [Microbotryomycetes sp. JL221]